MITKMPDFEKINEIYREKKEKFERFRELLLAYNGKYNLTTILDEKEMLIKHFYDSLAGEFLFPKNARVAEVGSGAGFPSLPLCVAREDLHFTLIESTGKKCDFLRTCAKELNLPHVTVCNLRAEEAGKESAMRERFDVCCARAVARLNTLAEYCMPLVRKGGEMIAYKGRAEEEIAEAKRAIGLLGGKDAQAICYELPENFGERTLVVVQKIKNTPEKYPRGNGKERKNPIV
jgi:16S rRNA (guanine527-N7)-methyltransferase